MGIVLFHLVGIEDCRKGGHGEWMRRMALCETGWEDSMAD